MTERKCKAETEQRSDLGKGHRRETSAVLCEEREKEGGLTANGDGVMAIDEGGKGVEVLH